VSDWLSAFGRVWGGVEDRWARFSRWFRRIFRRRRRQIEARAQEIAGELWDLVDDLPIFADRPSIAPVANQFYGHGAFMGAAPALLADPKWRRILAFLMPDVYRQVKRALDDGADPPRIIPMFENNPVMAAYGTWRSAALRRASNRPIGPFDLAGHEWDVFVDSDLVSVWEEADVDEAGVLVGKLVDTMLVAHATTTDTVQEQLGLCQYGDVRKTRKTEMGGVEAPAWMDLFARALHLAEAPELAVGIREMVSETRDPGDEECRRFTFLSPWPMSRAAEVYTRLTGRRHLSVILEIKSLRSTPALVAAVTAELNRRGVHVAAVGSFVREEIAGLSDRIQHVGDERLPGPTEILFFHTAGDLQDACDDGRVTRGQHALFNGASLLERGPDGYVVDDDVVADIEAYRIRHDLHLGYYVQEGDCDAAAASALSSLCDRNLATFELGFAWGGLQDEAAIPSGMGDHRGYGGQALLVRFGAAKTWRRKVDPGVD
jgi:hypothetical protein